LEEHGFSVYLKEPASFTPLPGGHSLLLGNDSAQNAREIARFSSRDVDGYAAFLRNAETLGAELYGHFSDEDPVLDRIAPEMHELFETAVADFVERFVETPVLQATLATDGLIGTAAGPRDAGTTYVLAHHYAGRIAGSQGAWGFVRGGMGALAGALAAAARGSGAQIRTRVEVAGISSDGSGVTVETTAGEKVRARVALSNADPRTTFLRLCAVNANGNANGNALPLEFVERVRAWRCEGVSLKVNLALGALPDFIARPGGNPQPHHRATIHVAPDLEYLQRAHDEAPSSAPMLECFMQTPTDPTLAPPGKHILSIFAQYFPYATAARWSDADKTAAARTIIETLAVYAPNLPDIIEEWDVLSPVDLERRIGLAGGQIFHGELLPGQIFEKRFDVRTPLAGLYLCGSGTHPGGCVSGFPGRRAAHAALADLRAVV
ncbi:MAG: NAD(P)/FAD-dependent oxidoreductase, partial [Candidatus Eremiobacteraeota bacterium]|nr:NAD(P)/FAD-dependent oxidoreductase [Candidatus Eremiobacteraeota bacterium]